MKVARLMFLLFLCCLLGVAAMVLRDQSATLVLQDTKYDRVDSIPERTSPSATDSHAAVRLGSAQPNSLTLWNMRLIADRSFSSDGKKEHSTTGTLEYGPTNRVDDGQYSIAGVEGGLAGDAHESHTLMAALAALDEQQRQQGGRVSGWLVQTNSEVSSESNLRRRRSDPTIDVTAEIFGFRVQVPSESTKLVAVQFGVEVRNNEEHRQTLNVAVYARNNAIRLPRQVPWPSRKFIVDDSQLVKERRAAQSIKDAEFGEPFRRVISDRIQLEGESSTTLSGEVWLDRQALHDAWERKILRPYSFGEYEIWLFDNDGRLLFERRYASIP